MLTRPFFLILLICVNDIYCIGLYLFQKKKKIGKKCYPRPRHGTLDPRQKDTLGCQRLFIRDFRFGQFLKLSGVPTFVYCPRKIQMFGGQTFMFEPTLNLFSRYVSTNGSKRRYHSSRVCVDVSGRDSCRFCTMFLN